MATPPTWPRGRWTLRHWLVAGCVVCAVAAVLLLPFCLAQAQEPAPVEVTNVEPVPVAVAEPVNAGIPGWAYTVGGMLVTGFVTVSSLWITSRQKLAEKRLDLEGARAAKQDEATAKKDEATAKNESTVSSQLGELLQQQGERCDARADAVQAAHQAVLDARDTAHQATLDARDISYQAALDARDKTYIAAFGEHHKLTTAAIAAFQATNAQALASLHSRLDAWDGQERRKAPKAPSK